MLDSGSVVAFIAATDLDRARLFYEQRLGLTVMELTDFACVFDANGTMLRVTAVPDIAHAAYTVLGWRVADIAARVQELTRHDVVFIRYDGMEQDDSGVWTTPGGDKVAWFSDPTVTSCR
jgi:hypothetical protein